jgi:CxxC motif-containing protein (DUF1111 family)
MASGQLPLCETACILNSPFQQNSLRCGRATALRDAIAAHDGEGRIVRDRFLDLSDPDKAAPYAFLRSL